VSTVRWNPGLNQPGKGHEGPFINRQGVQAEEPRDGLGEGEGEPGKWRHRWTESHGFWSIAEIPYPKRGHRLPAILSQCGKDLGLSEEFQISPEAKLPF
jgi:hypothetical protein